MEDEMKRYEDTANVNLPIALVRVRLDIDVIVVNRKDPSGHRVMAAHSVPDLNLLPVFYKPL
ncbi:MAG: hypothetical protein C0507_20625 [Cyanobacteria bacterium PR.3.49]|nr:hypothetical protein [Cyanobacteria bacterium PR.3.49]